MSTHPHPTDIVLHGASRVLEVEFDDGSSFRLPAEYLRVHSPSAEVTGHGPGQRVLVAGKREVGIKGIAPIGHYAIQLIFTDGHDSGIFTWALLYSLGCDFDANWTRYLAELEAAGRSRDPDAPLPWLSATKPAPK